MTPYKQMDEDSLVTEETPDGPTVILPTVMVNPGSQTTNPVSDTLIHVMMTSEYGNVFRFTGSMGARESPGKMRIQVSPVDSLHKGPMIRSFDVPRC